MARNTKQTGSKAASAASKVLSSPKSTPTQKKAAASDLSQAGSKAKQTGPRAASAAGKVLASPKSTTAQKKAAASDLAQTPTKSLRK